MTWFLFALLSTSGWAAVNVFDSLLVHRYEKSPILLMWSQALFSVPCLILLGLTVDVHSSWAPLLLIMGVSALLGDLWFFHVLSKLDVSVTNAAWAILSVALAAAGIFLFHETWGTYQLLGSALVLIGILTLSFWNQHVSLTRTLGLLGLQAVLYLPFYVVKKAALLAGESVVSVFFWMILSREILALSLPLLRRTTRTQIGSLVRRMDARFFLIGGFVIACFFLGEYAGAKSYQVGALSLVSMVNNVQPFFVMALAYGLHAFWPSYAPREVVSRESAKIKSLCFLIVFVGLALLAVSQ